MNVSLVAEDIAPLVDEIVSKVFEKVRAESSSGRLAWSEEEAAEMIGLTQGQLADERRRGKIEASQIVGKRIRYTLEDLKGYLKTRRYRHLSSV